MFSDLVTDICASKVAVLFGQNVSLQILTVVTHRASCVYLGHFSCTPAPTLSGVLLRPVLMHHTFNLALVPDPTNPATLWNFGTGADMTIHSRSNPRLGVTSPHAANHAETTVDCSPADRVLPSGSQPSWLECGRRWRKDNGGEQFDSRCGGSG